MGDVSNEDPAAHRPAEPGPRAIGRRTTGESIERGGGRLGVADLLAKVGAATRGPVTGDRVTEGPATEGRVTEGTAATDPVDSAATAPGSPPAPPRDAEALAHAIASIAARFLPGVPMGPDTDFFDAGGTSVDAVELVAALAREVDLDVTLDDVFADARPRRLAERTLPYAPEAGSGFLPVLATRAADPARSGAPDEDLDLVLADLARADALPWARRPEPAAPRRILLTGATGFLGGHMLLDLLRHSDAHVVCLVRAADEEAGLKRLGAALTGFALPWSAEIRRRVTVLPGDLRKPRLGLTDDQWGALADEVDSVVGVGAAVDFLRGYASLRQSNVAGPLTLAELAATGRPKPLHHISSIAVFNEVGIESMGEDDPVAHIDALAAGYDKSKWAAEAALRRAREHGLVVTLLRPGGIGGHTRTGANNPQDLSSGMMSAFSRFRTVPGFRYINAAPVDWVSRIAVAVVCEPSAWGYNYNLTGVPSDLSDVVRDMKFAGMNVRVQDWDEWRQDVVRRLKDDPVPELDFLARVLASPTARKLCEATLTGPAVTGERTEAFIAEWKLPPAARYGMREQTEAFERLARDGLARLPDRSDPPYLWFPETMEGALGPVGGSADSRCTLALTLSIASMYQLVRERRVDVRGELSCPLLHPAPLVVEHGDVWVRPEEGIPLEHGMRHPLLRYRLRLRDADGREWWLEGRKFARARRDLWRQTRALSVRLGRVDQPATLAGEVVVPSDSYVRDQVDGIRVDPRLSGQEKRVAKLTWLAWFGLEIGRGLLGPFARVGADLLDLRGTTTPTERTR
ncbi:thioester reductase domain-containing protein [Streptomyces formicae]|uniref:Polyketide synthase n=1 Tax=Streptomyces formicae TaxID=1616117 RepID=A0A291QJ79_9ACTN|nr:thioester reductase domain-containing protein [Streptomyces formicae]ATL31771.1 polyketide synthase [Streptomyces formicae]